MRIKYFTHGDGPIYGPISEELVTKVTRLGGSIINIPISTIISYGLIDRYYWIKAYLWDMVGSDVDAIVWLDGDIIAHKLPTWEDNNLFAGRIDCGNTVEQERNTHKCFNDINYYFNMGVFFMTRDMQPLMGMIKSRVFSKIHGNCIEQTWFNYYLNRFFDPELNKIHLLTQEYNWFRRAEERPDGLFFEHLANYRGIDKLLAFEGKIL